MKNFYRVSFALTLLAGLLFVPLGPYVGESVDSQSDSFERALGVALANLPAQSNKRLSVVLIHGVSRKGAKLHLGPIPLGKYFTNIPGELKFHFKTIQVFVPDLTTDGSIDERAALLDVYLKKKLGEQKAHLIGHSIGGLVARYVAAVNKNQNIASVTTIGTPNYGTPLATWAMRQVEENTIWYKLIKLFGQDLKGWRFLPQITPEAMRKFNARVLDRFDIRYFSVISGSAKTSGRNISLALKVSDAILRKEMGASDADKTDGVVPYKSQPWGKVLFELSYDHLQQVNHQFLNFNLDFLRHKEEVYITYKNLYNTISDRRHYNQL